MRTQLRPILAAVLAMLFPGLGHLLLRRWGRALLWHLTIVGGGVALLYLYDVTVDATLNNPGAAAAALPTDVALPLMILYGLSAIDAYLVGRADIAERKRADAAAEAVRRRAASGDDTDGGATASAVPVAAISGADGESLTVECPTCGKETDADLDFCHWCTEPLPWADGEE
jgi:hypothetical protein